MYDHAGLTYYVNLLRNKQIMAILAWLSSCVSWKQFLSIFHSRAYGCHTCPPSPTPEKASTESHSVRPLMDSGRPGLTRAVIHLNCLHVILHFPLGSGYPWKNQLESKSQTHVVLFRIQCEGAASDEKISIMSSKFLISSCPTYGSNTI